MVNRQRKYKPFPLHLALSEDEVRNIYDKEQYLFSHHRHSLDERVGTDAAVNAANNIERCNREHDEGEALRYLFDDAVIPSTRSKDIPDFQLGGSPKVFIGLCEHFGAVAQHGSGLVIPFAKILNRIAIHCRQAVTHDGAAALMPAALLDPARIQRFDPDHDFNEHLTDDEEESLGKTMGWLRRHVYAAGPSDWTLGRHRITRAVVHAAVNANQSHMTHPDIRANFINMAFRTNREAFSVKDKDRIAQEKSRLNAQADKLRIQADLLPIVA